MQRPTLQQRHLRFEDDPLWERLPEKPRDRCRRLLSQLLQTVIASERKREETSDE